MQFAARVEIDGINPFVPVNAACAETIQPGWRGPMPVLVQLNERPTPIWRTNMMPRREGGFYLYLDGRMRRHAHAQVGDVVTVTLSFDLDYRSGPQDAMPPAFASALEADRVMKARWDKLSPSLQKEVLRYLARLKSETARVRNLERALRVLGGAKERFLARDWN